MKDAKGKKLVKGRDYDGWAMKGPTGKLLPQTFSQTRQQIVARRGNWQPIVKVRLVEVGP